jgi:hypothetical protein
VASFVTLRVEAVPPHNPPVDRVVCGVDLHHSARLSQRGVSRAGVSPEVPLHGHATSRQICRARAASFWADDPTGEGRTQRATCARVERRLRRRFV